MDRKQQLFDVVEVLVNLVRNIRLRRELHSVCANPPLNFWRVIYGDLTDIAVLEWCKLFGSDNPRSLWFCHGRGVPGAYQLP
jgi:hypothetical protein